MVIFTTHLCMEIIFILAILVFLDRSKELVSKDKKKDLHLPLRELLMCLDIMIMIIRSWACCIYCND